MAKQILASIVALFPLLASNALAQVTFSAKEYFDNGHYVHLEGTLTGNGVGYPTNHQTLTCEKADGECLTTHIDSEGMLVFSEGPPGHLTIRAWTAAQIVAGSSSPCGEPPAARLKSSWQLTAFTTWTVDRVKQTAEVLVHECLGPKTYHWTVEDSAYWKDVQHDLGAKKP